MGDGAADGTGEGESGVELEPSELGRRSSLLVDLDGSHFVCVLVLEAEEEMSGVVVSQRGRVKKLKVN